LFFKGHQNTKNVPLEASFSPDSKYVFCGISIIYFYINNILKYFFLGSTDGRIHVWRTTDGEKLTTLTTDNSSDCIQCVQFNPKSFMLATASTNMVRKKNLFLNKKKNDYFILGILVTTCG